ncbi:MAG: type B 50S ribosomal protein L31 [Simkaniaceae bacterium]|nr:type B 50S ribosomal protein L31 [Simkaniaceae bacterium]
MQDDIHPPYQEVLFIDTATGHKFVCGSTLRPKEREMFEGREYPVHRVPVSSASHPFFTDSQQFVDPEGRVDKFRKRYARASQTAKKSKTTERRTSPKGRPAKGKSTK